MKSCLIFYAEQMMEKLAEQKFKNMHNWESLMISACGFFMGASLFGPMIVLGIL